ncbi:MAG: PIG-L family deacetylase [Nodosilinea sp.]
MVSFATVNKAVDYGKRRLVRRQLRQHGKTLEPSQKPAIIFAPHQDDETLGCGGLIALKRQQRVPVWVVFLTDGQLCYMGAPEPWPVTAEECIRLRQQEATAALDILGVEASNVVFLDAKDSTLGELEGEQRQRLTESLVHWLTVVQPGEVYVPHHKDVHSDHIATYDLVKAAVDQVPFELDLWQYLVWSLWRYKDLDNLPTSQYESLYSLPIESVRAQKLEALRTYRSQYTPITGGFTALPKTFMGFFDYPFELFVKA